MLVDCHTHWTSRFEPDGQIEPTGWLEFFGQQGVTHSLVLPLAGLLDDRQIQSENRCIATACAASGGRMIPFCTVNPWSTEDAIAELLHCIEVLNHRGLKIHPWLQGASPTSATMDQLCEIAGQHDIPVFFHDGTPCFSLPSQIALLASRHPSTTFILGHCGLFEHWREAIEAMSFADNLWACLCGPHPAALRQILLHTDRSRLVWGSDFGYGSSSPIEYRLDLLELLNLSDGDREKILCDNPARLLRVRAFQEAVQFELGAVAAS